MTWIRQNRCSSIFWYRYKISDLTNYAFLQTWTFNRYPTLAAYDQKPILAEMWLYKIKEVGTGTVRCRTGTYRSYLPTYLFKTSGRRSNSGLDLSIRAANKTGIISCERPLITTGLFDPRWSHGELRPVPAARGARGGRLHPRPLPGHRQQQRVRLHQVRTVRYLGTGTYRTLKEYGTGTVFRSSSWIF